MAWGEEYTITQITNNDYLDIYPRIHNGQLAWQGIDLIHSQIFFYDGAKISQLTNTLYGINRHHIYNGQIIWDDFDGIDSEIFLYTGSQIIKLTNNYFSEYASNMHNGKAVWWGWERKDEKYDTEIFLYDGTKYIQLTYNNYWDDNPRLHNGQIAWVMRFGLFSNSEIAFYNGTQTVQLTENNYRDESPQIHNGQIAWYGYDGNDYEIFLYNGMQTLQLTRNSYDDLLPQIYNGQIAWYGYDSNDYEIFFYDGKQTIQITDNNYNDYIPQIYDGKITWYGYDGNDYEIFFYDGKQTTQLTNNNYSDLSPQIDGGQITWYSYDGNDYEIFLAKPKAILEILDGVDFSAGKEVSREPEKLVSGGTPVKGAVTDGVTRLLLRLSLDEPQSVTFSLQGTGNSREDGVLRSLDGFQEAISITVNTVEVNGKQYAFAVYQTPENFVRAGYQEEDKKVSERTLSLKVEPNSGLPIQEEIKLVRPPVILVHGLWSNSDMWWELAFNLADEWPGIWIFRVDYEATNDEEFEVNKYKVRDMIEFVRTQYRSKDFYPEEIVMIQADVIGHSMGGLLARIWAGVGEDTYERENNFYEGDINKLITLDSPHFGSFLADEGMAYINSLTPRLRAWALGQFRNRGMALDRGAIDDLMTTSESIRKMNRIEIYPPSHTIIGDYPVGNAEFWFLPGDLGWAHRILTLAGYDTRPYVVQNRSDLVVSVRSQIGGLSFSASSSFEHHHLDATGENVANRAVELLNISSDSNLFEKGFPTQ